MTAVTTKTKTAIVILSDPSGGSEESLGRLFNALAAAREFKERGHDIQIVFQGTGTRWPAELDKADHPAHELYNEVREQVAGASCGCAEVFGARESVESCGLPLLKDYALPGTNGVASYAQLVSDGFNVMNF